MQSYPAHSAAEHRHRGLQVVELSTTDQAAEAVEVVVLVTRVLLIIYTMPQKMYDIIATIMGGAAALLGFGEMLCLLLSMLS